MSLLEVINLRAKLARVDAHWEPCIAAELNGQMVKLVKFQGEFVWHAHAGEDEMFLVVDGEFEMQLRDGARTVRAGEFIVIPHGVEHRPVAPRECSVLLFEPASTLNTGDAPKSARTRERLGRV